MAVLFNVTSESRVQNISTKLLDNWIDIGAVSPELPDNISPFISSFEIQAHFTAGRADRALDLIRRSWGWYLNNPNGTESTLIEGYLFNQSFGYRGDRGYDFLTSYVSHSHGWSSGPTSALTEFVLGISVTSPLGKTWKIAPQFGNLTSVEGGFSTELGTFTASWNQTGVGKYVLEFAMPEGTTGELVLPAGSSVNGSGLKLMADGVSVGMLPELEGGGVGMSDVVGGKSYVIVAS